MNDRIIAELLDAFRDAGLSRDRSLELGLQVLAWAKLSHNGSIPERLRLHPGLVGEPVRALEVLAGLADESGELRQAFSERSLGGRVPPLVLGRALEAGLRWAQIGLPVNWDPADLVASQPLGAGGEFSLPGEIADLLVGLAGLSVGESAYVAWDAEGQLAARAAKTGAMVYLENPGSSSVPALISLLGDRPFEIHQSDPIRSPSAVEHGKPRQFTVATAFAPMNQRYEPSVADRDWLRRFPERTPSGTVLAIRHLLSQASDRVVVAASNNLLFSTGVEATLRRDLLERGVLKAVVALPGGLLRGPGLPFCVLVLSPRGGEETVRFVNANVTRFREQSARARCRVRDVAALVEEVRSTEDKEYAKSVPVAVIADRDAQLQVERYVRSAEHQHLDALLESAPACLLGKIATFVRPMRTTMDDKDSLEAFEVGAVDLPARGYIDTPGRSVKIERGVAGRNENQFLRPLDIVLAVKGAVGKVGIVPPEVPPAGAGGWVAGQSTIVLRINPGAPIEARALLVQLRSPIGRKLLETIKSEATLPIIQLNQLASLRVLVPDAKTARRAAQALDQEADLHREIQNLQSKQNQLAADLWTLG